MKSTESGSKPKQPTGRMAVTHVSSPALSITIASYITGELPTQCLTWIIEDTADSDFEVIVSGDKPQDEIAKDFKSRLPEVRLPTNTTNRGLAAVHSQGLRRIRCGFVPSSNPDTLVVSSPWSRTVASTQESRETETTGVL